MIEVADNGGGITPSDYHAVTQKYHTSKLQEFSDLQVGHILSCPLHEGTNDSSLSSGTIFTMRLSNSQAKLNALP